MNWWITRWQWPKLQPIDFIYEDQEYVLLNVGENESWDGQKAARDVEKSLLKRSLSGEPIHLRDPTGF